MWSYWLLRVRLALYLFKISKNNNYVANGDGIGKSWYSLKGINTWKWCLSISWPKCLFVSSFSFLSCFPGLSMLRILAFLPDGGMYVRSFYLYLSLHMISKDRFHHTQPCWSGIDRSSGRWRALTGPAGYFHWRIQWCDIQAYHLWSDHFYDCFYTVLSWWQSANVWSAITLLDNITSSTTYESSVVSGLEAAWNQASLYDMYGYNDDAM